MQPVFDTSLYIAYAGARSEEAEVVERLERDFERVDRLLVPNKSDWAQTGRVLSQLGLHYGYEQIGRGRLTNDALIAMSSARMGITVLTENQRDFARLAQFRRFRWKVHSGTGPMDTN